MGDQQEMKLGNRIGKETEQETQPEPTTVEGTVTRIERHPKRANRYKVYIDDTLAFTVHEDVLVTYRIIKDLYIDAKMARLIAGEENRHAAWADALTFVGRRPRALREVKLYLKRRGHSEGYCQEAVNRLEEQGYVDDSQFAAQWVEHRIVEQRKGRRWVQQELQQKGVKRDIIQEALSGVNPEDELEGARHIAKKRWLSMNGEPQDKRRKLTAFLMRRGYAGSLVSGVIREILAAEKLDEMDELWEPEVELDMD